jgi:hypothetical protein
MYRKTLLVAVAGGGVGRVVLLIDNKRSLLSSLSCFLFCSCVDWTEETNGRLFFCIGGLELKVDIFVFVYGWLKNPRHLLMLGWFRAFRAV